MQKSVTVDVQLDKDIKDAARKKGLDQADIMRSWLRMGRDEARREEAIVAAARTREHGRMLP